MNENVRVCSFCNPLLKETGLSARIQFPVVHVPDNLMATLSPGWNTGGLVSGIFRGFFTGNPTRGPDTGPVFLLLTKSP